MSLLFACANPPEPAGIDSGLGNGDIPAENYCETIAESFCDFYLRCGRMVATGPTQCRERFLESCNNRYEPTYIILETAGHLSFDGAAWEVCASYLEDVQCTDHGTDLDGPCAAIWRGEAQQGEACGLGLESFVCAEGNACAITLPCGDCREISGVGGPCGDGLHLCDDAHHCVDGLCAASPALGEPCGGDLTNDCASNGIWCVDGICQAVGYVGIGQSCSGILRCPYFASCTDGVCVEQSALGDPCTTSGQCASGFCADGICAAPLPLGSPCDGSMLCLGGTCDNGLCVAWAPSCLP